MTTLVTAASGHLGRLVVHALLAKGVAADEVVATARDTSAIADLAELGVQTRRADYTDPASLKAAFAGVDAALLVSSNAVGSRELQHRNAVTAAAEAGVGLLAYTSLLRADRSDLVLVAEHRDTEDALRDSGIPHVLLRNGWYLENYTGRIAEGAGTGTVLGAAGDGRVAAAARADYAEAAAVVLTDPGHAGRVYELEGDTAFTMAELAEATAAQSGRAVAYRDVPEAEYAAALVAAGLPDGFAAALADADRGTRDGWLATGSSDLSRLIGRPTTPLATAVADALTG